MLVSLQRPFSLAKKALKSKELPRQNAISQPFRLAKMLARISLRDVVLAA